MSQHQMLRHFMPCCLLHKIYSTISLKYRV
uniref:Uncharacterized protein n=1 Tax=Arundo donax TaxID=35708 RepID=A0A0A8YWH8_ARUDO